MGDLIDRIGSSTVGQGIKTGAEAVGGAIFPEVPGAAYAPAGATSYIDRAMPLLGALGSTLESGNPISGYMRGRSYQQEVGRPYLQMQAKQQASAEDRAAALGRVDKAAAADPDPAHKPYWDNVRATLGTGLRDADRAYLYKSMAPPPPPKTPTAGARYGAVKATEAGYKPGSPEYAKAISDGEAEWAAKELAASTAAQRGNMAYADSLRDENEANKRKYDEQHGGAVNFSLRSDTGLLAASLALKDHEGEPGFKPESLTRSEILAKFPAAMERLGLGKQNYGTVGDANTRNKTTMVYGGDPTDPDYGRVVDTTIPFQSTVDAPVVNLTKDQLDQVESIKTLQQVRDEIRYSLVNDLQPWLEKHSVANELLDPDSWLAAKARGLDVSQYPELSRYHALIGQYDQALAKASTRGAISDRDVASMAGSIGTTGASPGLVWRRLDRQDEVTKKILHDRYLTPSKRDQELRRKSIEKTSVDGGEAPPSKLDKYD